MKKVCPFPFSSLAMEFQNQEFVPCCQSWLTDEFKTIPMGEDLWNGPAAQALRQSMFDQSFRYCKTQYCQKPQIELTPEHQKLNYAPINKENWQAMFAELNEMPNGPTFLNINADIRCNLACPSCRKEKVVKVDSEQTSRLVEIENFINLHKGTLRRLQISNGEVFFSPWLRALVKKLNPIDFPKLTYVNVITNGLLFDAQTYQQLLPGIEYVKSVSVSMDAGDQETFQAVRGGDWDRLLCNLDWMADLRKQEKIKYLQCNFTVQKNNYQSIPAFLKIARSFAVDSIKFTALFDWDNMAIDYQNHAVHLSSHPENKMLRKIFNKIPPDHRIWWALPIPDADVYQQPEPLHE